MKRLFLYTMVLGLIWFPTGALAQFRPDIQEECDAALDRAGEQLIGNRQLTVVNATFMRIAEFYREYPEDQPMALDIVLDGAAAADVMNSPQLLTSVSETIIQGCQPVGMVSFWVAESDWGTSFGRVGGRVREFECVDPGGDNLAWGYMSCL